MVKCLNGEVKNINSILGSSILKVNPYDKKAYKAYGAYRVMRL